MRNHDERASSAIAMTLDAGHAEIDITPIAARSIVNACSGICNPNGPMGTMACILALLGAALALVAARAPNSAVVIPRVTQIRGLVAAVGTRDADPPPDLTVLSISRT